LAAQAILDRDGELRITIPESVKASADDISSVSTFCLRRFLG